MLSGCVVKVGEGFCRLDTTGVHTEIGMGMAAIQENSGVQMGFFEKKIMAVVAGIISITIVDIIVLTILETVYRGHPLYSQSTDAVLLWDLAIMVAAVPIALPLVIQVFYLLLIFITHTSLILPSLSLYISYFHLILSLSLIPFSSHTLSFSYFISLIICLVR